MSKIVEELSGEINDDLGEFYSIGIGDSIVASVFENWSGMSARCTYYISDTPIDSSNAVEQFLRSFYEGQLEGDRSYCSGSSWTGIYSQNDHSGIGGHNIGQELYDNLGKYCYLKIEIDE